MSDNDLGGLISRAVAEKMTPEFVEKEIASRVDKLVRESIDDALRTYSTTGKLIKSAVEDALKVDRIDLPSYGDVVSKILKAQIEANVSDLVQGKLAEDMAELLSLAPKTIKLSEIAAEMLEQHSDKYGEVITVIVERNERGSAWVFLDEDNVYRSREKYQAKIRMLIGQDLRISHASIGDRDMSKSQSIGRAYGLEQKIRAYVACGTEIVIDEDFVTTSVGDY